MRKALIGLVLAATVLTPVAAQAQDRDREERRARAERSQRSEARGPADFDRREARQEARVERREDRQEARVERREARQPVRIQPAQQPVHVVQRQRSARPGSAYPQAWQGNPNDPRRSHYERLERQNQWRHGTREQRQEIRREGREDRRDWRDERRDDRRDWRDERRDDRRDWRSDRRSDRRDWNRDWNRNWRYDNRSNWSSWRHSNRNIFRGSRYYSPYRNHSYSRFGIGFFLEPLFFSRNYWVNDPHYYRLPPAPAGTRWIRYYNDVLLVDTWSGQVIDVVYDFFW